MVGREGSEIAQTVSLRKDLAGPGWPGARWIEEGGRQERMIFEALKGTFDSSIC